MKSTYIILLAVLVQTINLSAQTITSWVPKKINPNEKFVFYLHGAIIESQGANAVSSSYGAYEYNNILETFKSKGFNVISEARKNTDPEKYIIKVAAQIDSLLKNKVLPQNITVIGASKGAYITMLLSSHLNNGNINYVILASCDDGTFNELNREGVKLCGNVLSIYESSDSEGTCEKFFNAAKCLTNHKEVKLNMGLRHGFLYKPHKEWVNPAVDWANGKYK